MSKKSGSLDNRYYVENDVTTLRFYQLPKELLNHRRYRHLSSGAVVLYSVLMDRMQLSIQNKWMDKDKRYFIRYKVKPAQDDLRHIDEKPLAERSLSEVMQAHSKTISKYKKELTEAELIVEVKEGLGKTNRIYVLKLKIGGETSTSEGSDSHSQEVPKMPPQEMAEFPPNDTDLSEPDFNNTEKSQLTSFPEEMETEERPWMSVLEDEDLDEEEQKTPAAKGSIDERINEVHEMLHEEYGPSLLSKAIEIVNRQTVSIKGYPLYLEKVVKDLAMMEEKQQPYANRHSHNGLTPSKFKWTPEMKKNFDEKFLFQG